MTYFIELDVKAYFHKERNNDQKNEFERRIAEYARDKYSNSVINDESMDAMEDDLKLKIEEILKELPLCGKASVHRPYPTKFVIYYSMNMMIIFEIFLNEIIREYTDGVGL